MLLRLLRRPTRRAWALTVATCYLLGVTLGGCADHLLLHPWRYPLDAHGAERVELPFGTDRLEVWQAPSAALRETGGEPEAYVLEFTGNATRAEDVAVYVAQRWDAHAVEAWTPNYPGFGGSTGSGKLSKLVPSGLAAYDALAARANGKPIIVAGNSMGTNTALAVAARRPVAGLLMHSPSPLKQVVMGHHGWWNLWLLAIPTALGVPDDLDGVANARNCHAPAVFVTGTRDTLVPPKYQNLIIDAYAGRKKTLTFDADHNASPDERCAGFGDAVEWLWSEAVPAPTTRP